MRSTTEKYGMNKVHDIRIARGTRSPDINHRLIVAVEKNLLPRPQVPPQVAGKSNGVKLFPLNGVVLEGGWPRFSNPVARIVGAITKGTGGICKEGQVR